MTETWYSYLREENRKDRQRNRKSYKATSKRFWTEQKFGAASDVRDIKKTPQPKLRG